MIHFHTCIDHPLGLIGKGDQSLVESNQIKTLLPTELDNTSSVGNYAAIYFNPPRKIKK